jgi:hypothetical protein
MSFNEEGLMLESRQQTGSDGDWEVLSDGEERISQKQAVDYLADDDAVTRCGAGSVWSRTCSCDRAWSGRSTIRIDRRSSTSTVGKRNIEGDAPTMGRSVFHLRVKVIDHDTARIAITVEAGIHIWHTL